jgi:hypothetical protein
MTWHINHTSTKTYRWTGYRWTEEWSFTEEDLISLHVEDDEGRDGRVLPLTQDEWDDIIDSDEPDQAVADYIAAHPDYCSTGFSVLRADCPMRTATLKLVEITVDEHGLSTRALAPDACTACGALWMAYVSYTPASDARDMSRPPHTVWPGDT